MEVERDSLNEYIVVTLGQRGAPPLVDCFADGSIQLRKLIA